MAIEKFSAQELFRLKLKINELCPYGVTHFCDGKTNYSEAPRDILDNPPCPLRGNCPVKLYSTN